MYLLLNIISFLLLFQHPRCCDEAQLRTLSEESPLIITARIVDVAQEPGRVHCLKPSVQKVYFQVEEVLKGHLESREIVMGFFVSEGLPDMNSDSTALSSLAFRKGAKLLLFPAPDPGIVAGVAWEKRPVFISHCLTCGALPAEDATVESMRNFLKDGSK